MGSFLFFLSAVVGLSWFSTVPTVSHFIASLPQTPAVIQRQQSWPHYQWMAPLREATPPNGILVFHKQARHAVHHSRYYLWPRKVVEYHQFEGQGWIGPVTHVTGEPRELEAHGLDFPVRTQVGPWTLWSTLDQLPPRDPGPTDPFLNRHPPGRLLWCLLFGALLWFAGGATWSSGVFASVCGTFLWHQWNVTPLGFDSLAIWMQKAKNLNLTGQLSELVRNSPHPYYPPLFPLPVALLGGLGENSGHIVTLGFLFVLLQQGYQLIRLGNVPGGTAMMLSLSLLGMPALFLHSFYTMANLPFAALLVCAAVQLEQRRFPSWIGAALTLVRLEGVAVAVALLWVDRRRWNPKRLWIFAPLGAWLLFAHWVREPPPLHPLPFPYPPRWGEAVVTYGRELTQVAHWGFVPVWALLALIGSRSLKSTRALLLVLAGGWTVAATIAIGRWGNESFFQSFDRYFLPWFALAHCYGAAWAAQVRFPVLRWKPRDLLSRVEPTFGKPIPES